MVLRLLLRDGVEITKIKLGESSYTDDKANFNTKYKYSLIAVNDAGESEAYPFEITTLREAKEPAMPTGVHIVDSTSSSVKIGFVDQADNEDGIIVGVYPVGGFYYDAICEGQDLSECVVNELESGRRYKLEVYAFTYASMPDSRFYRSKLAATLDVSIPPGQ